MREQRLLNMVKEKTKKDKNCDKCGTNLGDEDTFRHMGMNYCRECVKAHIEDEARDTSTTDHVEKEDVVDEAQQARVSPEGKKAWTYKQY